jgi:epoxyqueuosine reductase
MALMPSAKTIIVLGANYGPTADAIETPHDRGEISVYARGRDYHDVLKKKMKQLVRWLVETQNCNAKVFVDTAPIMEKPLAQRAGVGWQGKHTNLVSRKFGSWLFLSEIFTTLNLPPDLPEADHCGNCELCMQACPTDALKEPYRIDPRRCVSYLTIEHSGAVEPGLMDLMGNHIYGCDDCLRACPWTKFQSPTDIKELRPRPDLALPRLTELAKLDDTEFRKFFSGSPIKRTGRDHFICNVLIAMGNSGNKELLPSARSMSDDPSSLVSKTARWAIEKLETS